jgi:hypothetical protein
MRLDQIGCMRIVMEYIAAEDRHTQLLVTVARVKVFFGCSKDKQDKIIEFAQTEEAPEDIERQSLTRRIISERS